MHGADAAWPGTAVYAQNASPRIDGTEKCGKWCEGYVKDVMVFGLKLDRHSRLVLQRLSGRDMREVSYGRTSSKAETLLDRLEHA